MKKFLLYAFAFACNITSIFAQKDFKSKQKTSQGSAPKQYFEEINATKKNAILLGKTVALHARVLIDDETKAVSYASNPVFAKDVRNAKKSNSAMSFDFLGSLKSELKISNPKEEFKILNDQTDDLGFSHIKVQQVFKKVPIYGAEAIIHTNKSGVVETLNGRIFPTLHMDVSPSISGSEAIDLALADLRKTSVIQKNGAIGTLLALDKDNAELTILPVGTNKILVYEVTVRPNILERWVYFINANSGEVVDKYNHTCTLDGVITATAKDLNAVTRSFKVSQVGNTYYMIDPTKTMYSASTSQLPNAPSGAIWTINAQNSKTEDVSDNIVQITSGTANNWNSSAVSAHVNASIAYDYYLAKLKRNSLNGKGGNIISVINIADDDGKGMDNAYWNGKFMGYGNGRDAFKPLAGALDVAGHEMTHGVIENTAKLEYRNQSGALNESMADVFGSLIDRDDWTLGEEVVKPAAYPSGALRSLENPNQGGKNDNGYQPKNMSQYAYLNDTPEQDNGGVHINSGIPNHAYYKFATGAGMNKDKAEQVYYRVLTTYLTRTAKFADLRLAVIQSSKDIFGDGQEVAAAKAAFDAVGITDPNAGGTTPPPPSGSTTPTNTDIPVNPGTQSLVVFDPREIDQSIYAGPFNTNIDLAKISTGLGCLSKPSVTDDGNFMYFVGKDKKVYRVDLAKKTAPTTVSSEAVWRNVAISKNGKVLAALTSTLDNFIYIFDLVNGKSKKIKLFNPTYTAGVKTGEVLYADSFEWNYSGEYLIYDAFNQVKNISTNIEFWDVGILRAWDPVKNDFGDGSIEKMFTNLEEGDNIGNPALAKTNTNILAFDYFSGEADTYSILAIDFSKSANSVSEITTNNTIGYPDFSKTDRILVFNSADGNVDVVKGVNLKADKITKEKEPVIFYTDAKWAVWYAAGERTLPTKQAQEVKITGITDKTPGAKFDILASASSNLVLQYVVVSGDAAIVGKTVSLGSKPGKVVLRVIQAGDSKFNPANSEITFCIIPPNPTLSDQGLNVVASGGTLYQFYLNGSPIGGQTTNASLKKEFLIGQFSVKNVTSDGCSSGFSNAIGVAALGSEPGNDLNLIISPNPSSDFVSLKMPAKATFQKATVYSSLGVKVLESADLKLDVRALTSGAYIVVVTSKEGELTGKFIKK
jgi:bacillolysin